MPPSCWHGVCTYKSSMDPVTGELRHAYVCEPCGEHHQFEKQESK